MTKLLIVVFAISSLAVACGGSTPPVEAPKADPAAAASGEAPKAPETPATPEAPKAEEKK